MADILLSHGYFLHEDEHELRVMKPYPPLGLLSVSAFLRRSGFEVDLFDSTFAERGSLHDRLESGEPSVLGLYVNLTTRGSAVRIIARARELGWRIVLGGPEPANYPAEYLAAGADVIVLGEGELTLQELLRLESWNPRSLVEVAGVVFAGEDGKIVTSPARDPISDLDKLPWPDREHVDIQRYVDTWREHHGKGSVNLITARGCPYKCRWCSHAVFGYTHRRRSPQDCADELQWIVDRYAPEQVWYADDVFTISHKWLYEYHGELKKRDLFVPFETISRADRMMKEDVIATLADMGCWRIWIGSESGSQKILDRMERGVKVEQVQWATRVAREHGIQVGMFLMWGYEGEEFEDIEATVNHVCATAPDTFLTTVSYPIRGTPYFEEVSDRVTTTGDWAEVTDRDYALSGRRPTEYYRVADEWLRLAAEGARLGPKHPEARKLLDGAEAARRKLAAFAAEV